MPSTARRRQAPRPGDRGVGAGTAGDLDALITRVSRELANSDAEPGNPGARGPGRGVYAPGFRSRGTRVPAAGAALTVPCLLARGQMSRPGEPLCARGGYSPPNFLISSNSASVS
jgi:hypothetical protein